MKKLIINADDFGCSKENNIAILKGLETGIITSTSLMVNLEGFEHAVNEIIPKIPKADIGFHFNITEGKSLTNQPMLCDKEGNFNRLYTALLFNSFKKEFLRQVETEFRAQIEKALRYTNISHIDSHRHTHAIPSIFNLIVKLAKEYGIPYIRTQNEIPYIVWKKSFNHKFAINIIKNILLNTFTLINKRNKIKTNDYFIGVLYTGYMDEDAILEGLKKVKENSITEVIFHPALYEKNSSRYREFLITQNLNFKENLKNSGFSQSTYYDINSETERAELPSL